MDSTGNIPSQIKSKSSKKTIFLKFVLPPILLLIIVILFFMSAGLINYQLKVMSCGNEPIVAQRLYSSDYYRPQDYFYKDYQYEYSKPIPRIEFMHWGTTTLYCSEKEAIDAGFSNDDSATYQQYIKTRSKEHNKYQ